VILLDTNVISELIRPIPDPIVTQWSQSVRADQMAVTTVVLAEIELGLACMPEGKRKSNLTGKLNNLLQVGLSARIFTFDLAAVSWFGELGSRRKSMGRATSTADLMIAAIAASRGFSLCTRNVTDFEHCGIPLLNPWQ
jgi:toxin FitB